MRLRELAYAKTSQPERGRWNYQGYILGPRPRRIPLVFPSALRLVFPGHRLLAQAHHSL